MPCLLVATQCKRGCFIAEQLLHCAVADHVLVATSYSQLINDWHVFRMQEKKSKHSKHKSKKRRKQDSTLIEAEHDAVSGVVV